MPNIETTAADVFIVKAYCGTVEFIWSFLGRRELMEESLKRAVSLGEIDGGYVVYTRETWFKFHRRAA